MKKYSPSNYVFNRLSELCGNSPTHYLMDEETKNYTSKRIRELKGEIVEWDIPDDRVAKYCSQRIRELRLESHVKELKLSLDNRKLGCYTINIMGDTDADY